MKIKMQKFIFAGEGMADFLDLVSPNASFSCESSDLPSPILKKKARQQTNDPPLWWPAFTLAVQAALVKEQAAAADDMPQFVKDCLAKMKQETAQN